MTVDADPLILTLGMDEASFARFEALRRRHFPPERNFIPAHLTLFHHLPGEQEARVAARLAEVARPTAPTVLAVTGLRFLGRGVAYALDGDELPALRGRLAAEWRDWLSPQDRQNFRPHVTVQNKVSPAAARALHEMLARDFRPFAVRGTALLLWRYRGGPWEPAGTFRFGAALSPDNVAPEPTRT